MKSKSQQLLLQTLVLFVLVLSSNTVSAHGSVVLGDDRCLISIDFLEAHFTVYQPETRENDEFCEAIPDVDRSVFVMEYLHEFLKEMPIDFRIIEDTNNIGKYARWEDVEIIEDIDAVTVFYEEPRIEPGGYYSTSYDFQDKGTYIGIVSAKHPTEDKIYSAVFYFRVGGADLGSLPIFVFLLIVLQLGYWISTGGWTRFKQKRSLNKTDK